MATESNSEKDLEIKDQEANVSIPSPDHDHSESPTLAASGNDEIHRSQHVARLARTVSTLSNIHQNANPFLATDPALDPTSPQFNVKIWLKTLLHAFSQDPDKYPRHHLGFSYRNLGAYGYGSSSDYQKDVLNVLWRAPSIIHDRISRRRRKIQILQGFDGLVRKGEMVLVLGRPGRSAYFCTLAPLLFY
jgi:ATP-binding cassette, subfamily G (WHITE), member 2, PDR